MLLRFTRALLGVSYESNPTRVMNWSGPVRIAGEHAVSINPIQLSAFGAPTCTDPLGEAFSESGDDIGIGDWS